MLGCHCLRHKVVLLRKPKKEEVNEENSPSSQTLTEDEESSIKTKRKKKKKKKSVAYGKICIPHIWIVMRLSGMWFLNDIAPVLTVFYSFSPSHFLSFFCSSSPSLSLSVMYSAHRPSSDSRASHSCENTLEP